MGHELCTTGIWAERINQWARRICAYEKALGLDMKILLLRKRRVIKDINRYANDHNLIEIKETSWKIIDY